MAEDTIRRVPRCLVEQDPHGIDQHKAGAKMDAGKPQLYRHLVAMFPRALTAVSQVSAVGEEKYTYMGWAAVPDGEARYREAGLRHLFAEACGEVVDQADQRMVERGITHAAQASWNALARLELMLKETEK